MRFSPVHHPAHYLKSCLEKQVFPILGRCLHGPAPPSFSDDGSDMIFHGWSRKHDRKWLGESRSEDIRVMDADWPPAKPLESVPACVTRGGNHKAAGLSLNAACFPPPMITRGFLCLFKQVPYLCAWSTTAVQLAQELYSFFVINRTSREKICLFWVFFPQFGLWSMHCISVWSPCLWCGAEQMCVLHKRRTLSCVINNHVIHCYCSLEAGTDWTPAGTNCFKIILKQ